MTMAIANNYGNVDVRTKLSKRYVHIRGPRLTQLCDKSESRTPRPWLGSRARRVRLLRINGPQTGRRRQKVEEERQLRRKGILPGSMTAKWLKRGEVDETTARLIAFKAKYRHEHTDYDDCLDQERELGTPWEDRQWSARDLATEEPIPNTWPEYLDKYRFDDDISRRLADVLKDPVSCHPVWFMKAKLAVEQPELRNHP